MTHPNPDTRCAGCKECLNSNARTGEECIKIRDCECHNSNPVIEVAKQALEQFGKTMKDLAAHDRGELQTDQLTNN